MVAFSCRLWPAPCRVRGCGARFKPGDLCLMRKYGSIFLVLLLGMGCLGEARARDLKPGELFPSPLLNVHVPNEQGWRVLHDAQMSLLFERKTSGGTDSAQVMFFPMPYPQTTDEFISFIQTAINSDLKTRQVQLLDSKLSYLERQGQPCLLFSAITRDVRKRDGFFSDGATSPAQQTEALYCRHPFKQRLGYLTGFSHTGMTDPNLKVRAQAFFSGITAPQSGEQGTTSGTQRNFSNEPATNFVTGDGEE